MTGSEPVVLPITPSPKDDDALSERHWKGSGCWRFGDPFRRHDSELVEPAKADDPTNGNGTGLIDQTIERCWRISG
jgi:hypothetical protein